MKNESEDIFGHVVEVNICQIYVSAGQKLRKCLLCVSYFTYIVHLFALVISVHSFLEPEEKTNLQQPLFFISGNQENGEK